MRKPEWQQIAETIIRQHDGQMYFNFREVREIVGCGKNSVLPLISKAGILVKKVGRSKKVSAYDIATMMCSDRVSALD